MIEELPDRQQFARQLANWTEQVIENGRTPFRRVDLYPAIQTQQGVLQPPLVFWINRQSMMAGGILLLPEQDLSSDLLRGRDCAEALGLRHFVTWETDRIRVWQLQDGATRQHQEFLFPHGCSHDNFRQQLESLLETLKLLAVIGMAPPDQLSAHYLHNLLQTSLSMSLPPLQNSFRSQRAQEAGADNGDADLRATEANRQLLLKLLALLWYRQLPSAILPDKLERAIELSLPKLPESLQQALRWEPADSPASMPHETMVCCHHLLLRLQQLAWDQPQKRALTALELLIGSWFPPPSEVVPAQVRLYPESPQLAEETVNILSDSPTLLAATALLERIREQPVRQQHFGNLLQFSPETLPLGNIDAVLTRMQIPGREQRQQFTTTLRTSWPNRRLKLSANTPLWLWEAIHLLGLYQQTEPLQLTMPDLLLQLPADEPIWAFMLEHYQVLSATRLPENRLKLGLKRGSAPGQLVQIHTLHQEGQFAAAAEPHQLRCQLILSLRLSEALYQLCTEKLVQSGVEALSETAISGLKTYSSSALGQHLWHLLCKGSQPDSDAEFSEQATGACWLQPETSILEQLALLSRTEQQHAGAVDKRLSELLQCPAIEHLESSATPTSKSTAGASNLPGVQLRKQLIRQLENEGLPTFPEKYLYFLEQPVMTSYSMTPPLRIQSELLGQCELIDAAGKIIQVYGEETVEALRLSSDLNKTSIDLPQDRQQVAQLLNHYREDLIEFQRHLNELCFSQVQNSTAARKLARKTWSELDLPPLKWLEKKT